MQTDDLLPAAIAELRHRIQDRGLSQRDAAKIMGIAPPNLSRILGPRNNASLDRVLQLLCRLGVDIVFEAHASSEGVGHITFRGKATLTNASRLSGG